jgi:hypothetical protein
LRAGTHFFRRLVAFAGWLGVRLAPSCLAAVLPCPDPFSREMFNLKVDAIIAGLWIGVMGMNAYPRRRWS